MQKEKNQLQQKHTSPSDSWDQGSENQIFLTVNQAAKYLQLSPKTIWTHTKLGLLPVCRIGGLLRYRKQALDETLVKLETRSNVRK